MHFVHYFHVRLVAAERLYFTRIPRRDLKSDAKLSAPG
jgi:hypothetical protein